MLLALPEPLKTSRLPRRLTTEPATHRFTLKRNPEPWSRLFTQNCLRVRYNVLPENFAFLLAIETLMKLPPSRILIQSALFRGEQLSLPSTIPTTVCLTSISLNPSTRGSEIAPTRSWTLPAWYSDLTQLNKRRTNVGKLTSLTRSRQLIVVCDTLTRARTHDRTRLESLMMQLVHNCRLLLRPALASKLVPFRTIARGAPKLRVSVVTRLPRARLAPYRCLNETPRPLPTLEKDVRILLNLPTPVRFILKLRPRPEILVAVLKSGASRACRPPVNSVASTTTISSEPIVTRTIVSALGDGKHLGSYDIANRELTQHSKM